MNQADVQKIIDASIGNYVLIDGNPTPIPIVGRYSERYMPNGIEPHVENILALEGGREVGLYPDANQGGYGLWSARYCAELPMGFLPTVRSHLVDSETGKMKRLTEEGRVAKGKRNYVFGGMQDMPTIEGLTLREHEVNLFACFNHGDDRFEAWGNYVPKDVEVFEPRPYGWKRMLSDKSQILIIEPRKHTGLNAPLNEHGLRGNPGSAWERVMHLGYLDGSNGDASLLHRYQDGTKVVERTYRKGQAFFYVYPEGSGESKPGYWSLLMNTSSKPIKLFIHWENE